MRRLLTVILALLGVAALAQTPPPTTPGRWSEQQANDWYKAQPWLVGANYAPASAINELEMWQADTFDPKRIDTELGWAAAIGMNTMRVFLHDLLWQQDAEGFKKRLLEFLRHRRQAPHQDDVRALRFSVGSESAVGPAAGAQTRRPQLGLAPEPWRQGVAGPERVRPPRSLRQGRRRLPGEGCSRPRLGRMERAGQHERIQLPRAGAGQQGGARAQASPADVRVGAQRPAAAAADERRVAG